MANYLSWAEFGEGRYPDCHYEGRQWPGSLREMVLEGFVDATYLRLLYPARSSTVAMSQTSGSAHAESKTCANCKNWMKTTEYEGICSLSSTEDTVEARFSCEQWEDQSSKD